MKHQTTFDFDGVNLTEQELLFCRLLQFNLKPTFAAEAVKLDTDLMVMHGYTYEDLANQMLNRPQVQKYLKNAKLFTVKDNPAYDVMARAKKEGITLEDLQAYTDKDLRAIRDKFTVKQSVFYYLLAQGNSITASAEIAMAGKNKSTQRSMGGRYLREKDALLFASRLVVRFFKDTTALPLTNPKELLVEARVRTGDDVRDKLIELELAAKNFTTKVMQPVIRRVEALLPSISGLEKLAETIAQLKADFENLKGLEDTAKKFEEELAALQQQLTDLTETEGEDALW